MAFRAGRARLRAATADLSQSQHIEVRNVPSTATPADIRRILARGQAEGVVDVAMIYKAFSPTRTALVSLTLPNYLQDTIRILHGARLSGSFLAAIPRNTPPTSDVVAGDGPRGGLTTMGVSVIVSGLPFRGSMMKLERLMQDYKLANVEKPTVKVPTPDGQFSRVARCLIHFASTAEAHRFVRTMHGTYLTPEIYGTTYPLSARVVY